MVHKKHKLKASEIPDKLRIIPSPPRELYVAGDNLGELLARPCVAIVGSRKVTPYGKSITVRLAGELASHGIIIVSGLALGVDSIAHQAALDAGGGTIAVLPTGLDQIYPRCHLHLAKNILAKGGAIISEYPPGTEPFPANFVARNRLVSGLGDVVLITEAAEKSGTLHTANFALSQGKTVMCVPGNITSAQSMGTNNLIKTGALPVTDVDDILQQLNIPSKGRQQQALGSNQEEQIILDLLSEGISDGYALLTKSKLDTELFNQTLTMLEITGKIKPLGNNHWGYYK